MDNNNLSEMTVVSETTVINRIPLSINPSFQAGDRKGHTSTALALTSLQSLKMMALKYCFANRWHLYIQVYFHRAVRAEAHIHIIATDPQLESWG